MASSVNRELCVASTVIAIKSNFLKNLLTGKNMYKIIIRVRLLIIGIQKHACGVHSFLTTVVVAGVSVMRVMTLISVSSTTL